MKQHFNSSCGSRARASWERVEEELQLQPPVQLQLENTELLNGLSNGGHAGGHVEVGKSLLHQVTGDLLTLHMAGKHLGCCVPTNVGLRGVCETKKGFCRHSKQHMGFTLQQVCSTALEAAVESFSSFTASSLYGKYRLGLIFSMWKSLP